ncbi:hypothetical protein CUMW_155610 [Citrus unshiu]|nr:hypothetical protein CUMW_155610 [Citrus unshiu]
MEGDDEYRRKERVALVVIVVVASLALASLLVAFSYYCYIRNKVSKRLNTPKRVDREEKGESGKLEVTTDNGLQVFTFKQLHSATGGFSKSNVVGHGGFGLVYRGVLSNGRKVAIKLMDQAGKQGEDEFKMEVELLGRLRSPYLLALLGYCSDRRKLLVYDYMANGGLQEHLYPANAGGHVSTRVLGTQGYVAPEYALTGHLTTKSDVYSYGVVLLELLTGRVPIDVNKPSGEGVLVSWALPRLTDREKILEIMDPALEGQYSMKEVIQVAAIAAMCVQPEADYRPLMADVAQSLVPLVKYNRSTPKISSSPSFHASRSPAFPDKVGD